MSRSLVTLALTKHITVLLERATDELGLLPQVGSEERVSTSNRSEGSLKRILERLGRSGRCCVDVIDTGKLKQTLDGWRGDEAGTTWSWDELGRISLM